MSVIYKGLTYNSHQMDLLTPQGLLVPGNFYPERPGVPSVRKT